MRYVCTITRHAGQSRITLPKEFLKEQKLETADYIVIDDRDPKNIKIGGLVDVETDRQQGGNG